LAELLDAAGVDEPLEPLELPELDGVDGAAGLEDDDDSPDPLALPVLLEPFEPADLSPARESLR
jgi:hypothetical protein